MAKVGPGPKARNAAPAESPATRMPMRRRFSVAYKLQMIQQAERAVREGKGALQALLAREGLYSSHLAQWRRRNREGSLKRARRGRPALGRQALLRENARLKRKLAYLEARLREAVLDVRPPQGRGAAAHADWIMRQRMLYLANLARAAPIRAFPRAAASQAIASAGRAARDEV